ncbi:MAG: hypothetical protein QME78_10130 [Thermodesulfobacteriota bacterium]|nr:hypothetical protein [Thermodesulfobacteriota bacterium]
MAHTMQTDVDRFYFVPGRGRKLGKALLDQVMDLGARLYLIPKDWWLRPGWC